MKQQEIFLTNADQGLLNYVVHKKAAAHQLSVAHYNFFIGRYEAEKIKSLKKNILNGKKV